MNAIKWLAPFGMGLLMVCCQDQPGSSGGPERSRMDFQVVEVWEPACMMARPELHGINDPDEFERQALRWLETNGARIAAKIAARHNTELVSWRHDPDYADNTPFGATVVVLRGRH